MAVIVTGAPAEHLVGLFTVTVGLLAYVIVTVLVAAAQGANCPVVDKVSVTLPAAISAADGVYTAFSVVLFGLNVPVPPDQTPPVALPPTTPASVTLGVLEHTVWLVPAAAVGRGLTVIVLSSVTGEQPAGALVVNLKVTVPVKFACGV